MLQLNDLNFRVTSVRTQCIYYAPSSAILDNAGIITKR